MLSKRGGGTTTEVEALSAREALTSAAALTNCQLVRKLNVGCGTYNIHHVGTVGKDEQ
jgi:hypothetical protein